VFESPPPPPPVALGVADADAEAEEDEDVVAEEDALVVAEREAVAEAVAVLEAVAVAEAPEGKRPKADAVAVADADADAVVVEVADALLELVMGGRRRESVERTCLGEFPARESVMNAISNNARVTEAPPGAWRRSVMPTNAERVCWREGEASCTLSGGKSARCEDHPSPAPQRSPRPTPRHARRERPQGRGGELGLSPPPHECHCTQGHSTTPPPPSLHPAPSPTRAPVSSLSRTAAVVITKLRILGGWTIPSPAAAAPRAQRRGAQALHGKRATPPEEPRRNSEAKEHAHNCAPGSGSNLGRNGRA
jgi:hypothetical protein